jgi:hypothetical protein
MLKYQLILIIILLIITALIIYIYWNNSIYLNNKVNQTYKTKVILFYSSNKQLCLNIIENIWKPIIEKYKHNEDLEFILIDIYKNSRYNNIVFNEIPKIYVNNNNDIYPFTNSITYDNLSKFIIDTYFSNKN